MSPNTVTPGIVAGASVHLALRKIEPRRRVGADQAAELGALAERVGGRLKRSAADILAIGADLARAKTLLGHGRFGDWLDAEFSLSKRTAEQFMAAARRFGDGSEAVSHLPSGAVLELSAPSVPDELVQRVLAGEVAASVSAIRRERSSDRGAARSADAGAGFLDFLDRFEGTAEECAAGVAAHVLRRWKAADDRAWFAGCIREVAEMIEVNLATKIPLLELSRTTVRMLREQSRQ